VKILVPNTITLDLSALGEDVVSYDARASVADEHRDTDVLVVWQNSAENLADAARKMTRLKLVQTLAAGPDAVMAAGFADDVMITSGRSLHDGPVAEHALALVLALVRRLDVLAAAQKAHVWDRRYIREQASPGTEQRYTLDGAAVTVWGFGSIAARLAPMLAALGADVTGVANTAGDRFGFPVAAVGDLPEVLRRTDVLISLLPADPETVNALDEELMSALPESAIFVNVGRGATVDENALMSALRSGRLRAAAIDVTKDEPLPADSPLWDIPNLMITPHVAGNRPKGASELVLANVLALREKKALTNLLAV
jgi:phosphoglycerate dehydrogenase-like enzyme